MRLDSLGRRALLSTAAACCSLIACPAPAPADAPPTYSLKGVPGLSALTGADRPPPADLGVIGRGSNGQKAGRLGFCEKKGCVSTYADPESDAFVPAWTYDSSFSMQAKSSFDSRKEQLKAEARAEAAAAASEASAAAGGSAPKPSEAKSAEVAIAELKAAVEAQGGTIRKIDDRYLYAEFTDAVTGVVDDVEFLLGRDSPLVNYRSVPRGGGDDKRQRNRIRDLRKSLQPLGWKSVGRIVQ